MIAHGNPRSVLDGAIRRGIPAGNKARLVGAAAAARPARDLPNAVKHLDDGELDRLLAVVLAEAKRRGRQPSPTEKPPPRRRRRLAVSLTRGQVNAVRAAFKAGITPARIQFGLSQSDVRKALAIDARGVEPID